VAAKRPGPFALPGGVKGSKAPAFPIGDAKHARLAISGATRSQRAGNINSSQAAKIKAAARAKLKKGK
jgi:hypothetical protein